MWPQIGLRFMSILIPTGAIGVALKEYVPSIASNAKRRGLVVQGRIMFRAILHCSVILHQFDMRN